MSTEYKQAKNNYRKKVGELATKTQYIADPIKGIIAIGIESWKQYLEPLSRQIIEESIKNKQIDNTSHVNLKYWGLNGYEWEYDILKECLDNKLKFISPGYDYWDVTNSSFYVDYYNISNNYLGSNS